MLSISITLGLAIFAALSSAGHGEQLAVADFPFLSNAPPSVDPPNKLLLREDGATEQDSRALRKRDITIGWYSHKFTQNYLYQWIFGNATNHFNISISTCVKGSSVAGVYQFVNGSSTTDATVGDIYRDLGYGTTFGTPQTMIAQTLINAEAAYQDISNFLLNSILCSGDSQLKDDIRRQLLFSYDGFRSDGQVTTLLLQSVGAMAVYFTWAGLDSLFKDPPGVKTLFGGIATFNLILMVGLLENLRQEGVRQPYQAPFVGSLFVAYARSLLLQATRSGRATNQAAGACLPASQMMEAAVQAGSGSAPAQELGVLASADVPGIQATCANSD